MPRRPVPRRRLRPVPAATTLVLWLVVLVPPLVVLPMAWESFRFPKLLACEILGLASLALLAWRLRNAEKIELASLLRHPAVLATMPLLAVASLGLASSEHPHYVRQALASLWIAGACLIGWSLALGAAELRRLLAATVLPATLLAVVAVLQYAGLFTSFDFADRVSQRIGLTSLAGGAFDLAAYLVLPILVAQQRLWQASRRRRALWGGALAVCLAAVALTQTVAALAALLVASLVLWGSLLPRRRLLRAAAAVAVVGAVLVLAFAPLRGRLLKKVGELRRGEVNRVLTGRLDPWRAAWWMVEKRPLLGVGHGAYQAEFGVARLALRREGVRFYRGQNQVYFDNAHGDFIQAVAEWGLAGAVALVWGLAVLARQLHRRALHCRGECSSASERGDLAVMRAVPVALGVLALASFPMHLALVAYPHLLCLGWILQPLPEAER